MEDQLMAPTDHQSTVSYGGVLGKLLIGSLLCRETLVSQTADITFSSLDSGGEGLNTFRELDFGFFLNWMGYDRNDNLLLIMNQTELFRFIIENLNCHYVGIPISSNRNKTYFSGSAHLKFIGSTRLQKNYIRCPKGKRLMNNWSISCPLKPLNTKEGCDGSRAFRRGPLKSPLMPRNDSASDALFSFGRVWAMIESVPGVWRGRVCGLEDFQALTPLDIHAEKSY